jgi:hypothetical protein
MGQVLVLSVRKIYVLFGLCRRIHVIVQSNCPVRLIVIDSLAARVFVCIQYVVFSIVQSESVVFVPKVVDSFLNIRHQ